MVQNFFYVLWGSYEFNVKQQLHVLLSKKIKYTLQFSSEDVEEPLYCTKVRVRRKCMLHNINWSHFVQVAYSLVLYHLHFIHVQPVKSFIKQHLQKYINK